MNGRGVANPAAAAVAVGVALCVVPFVLSDYNLRIAVLALITALAVIGLAIAFGWAGLIQLGQAAFIGVGAYTAALLTTRAGLDFWIATPLAMAASALLALVIAVPMLRLRGHYLALATVGLNVTSEIVMKNWQAVTGGDDGLGDIPGVSLFGTPIATDLGYYFLALAFVVVVAALALVLRHTRLGRAMIAVRDDELAAGTSGVAVVRTRVIALVLASALAGLSGSLYAHYAHFVSPQDFDLARSVVLLVMLIVGGEISIVGAVVGTFVLSFLPEWLRFAGGGYLAIFGALVLVLLVVMPDGIAGRLRRLTTR